MQELTCRELGLTSSAVRARVDRDGTDTLRVSRVGSPDDLDLPEECWAELLDHPEPAGVGVEGLATLTADTGSVGSAIGMAITIRGRSRGVVAFWGPARDTALDPGDARIVILAVTHISTLVHIQQELNRAVLAFRRMSTLEGDDLMRQAAQEASMLVRAPHAFIAERDQTDDGRLRILAFSSRGTLGPSFEFAAAGTPCEAVLSGHSHHVQGNLRETHPGWAPAEHAEADAFVGVPIMNWSGEVLGVLGVMDDEPIPRATFQTRLLGDLASRVSAGIERARMDETLRASQQRLEVALNAGGIAIWEIDLVRGHVEPSATAAALVGLEPDEAPRDFESWQRRLHPDDLERESARFQALNEDQREEFAADLRIRHRDGTFRWILATGRLFSDGNRKAARLISAGIDVTEKKRFEERLQQSQKMENLATLAGGIAHDFNNLLMSIGGNASLALRDGPIGRVAERLQQVSVATERAAELTRQMLVYAGRGATEPRVLNLGSLVEDISSLLDTVISKKAQLELDCDESPNVEADPTQLRQVVMNLLTNASEALGGEIGRISVSTGRRHVDRSTLAECLGAADLPPGQYAYIRVTDTGKGMDPTTRARMFDPFFTTKPSGRGLGMAVVIGAVIGHRGTIRVRSSLGEGCEITVFLPISEKPLPVEDTIQPSAPARIGAGKVLIVEDEQMIRELAATVLEDAGYEVVTATGGRDGLDRFAEHRDGLLAVLLDVTMPDLSGLEVLSRIRAAGADTPVILMSGYAESEVHPPTVPAAAYLKKPFPIDALIDTIQHVVRG